MSHILFRDISWFQATVVCLGLKWMSWQESLRCRCHGWIPGCPLIGCSSGFGTLCSSDPAASSGKLPVCYGKSACLIGKSTRAKLGHGFHSKLFSFTQRYKVRRSSLLGLWRFWNVRVTAPTSQSMMLCIEACFSLPGIPFTLIYIHYLSLNMA